MPGWPGLDPGVVDGGANGGFVDFRQERQQVQGAVTRRIVLEVALDDRVNVCARRRQHVFHVGRRVQPDVRTELARGIDSVAVHEPPLQQAESAYDRVHCGRVERVQFRVDVHTVGRQQ